MPMTTKIANTTVLVDGHPTKAGKRLMELCHEAAGMGCWHDWNYDNRPYICKHGCGTEWHNGIDISHAYSKAHPAYLKSLDSFRPIWEKIEQAASEIGPMLPLYQEYVDTLKEIVRRCAFPQPYHHLEALAITLAVECGCDYGLERNPPGSLYINTGGTCPTCSGTGCISVLDQWTQEMEEALCSQEKQ